MYTMINRYTSHVFSSVHTSRRTFGKFPSYVDF